MSNDLSLVPAPIQYSQTIIQRAFTVLQQTFSNYSQVKAAAENATSLLATVVVPVSNHLSAATTLMSYEVVPNTIARIGTKIRITAFGTLAANANAKEVQLYFGGTLIGDSTSQTASGGNWSFDSTITVTNTNTELAITSFNSDNTTYTKSINYVMASETLSAILTIKVTGTGVTTDDITQNGLSVELYPANPLTTTP